jgi:hypothetical protein
MNSTQDSIEVIQRQMAVIRRKQDDDIGGLVAGAEKLAAWTRRIRIYFWSAVAAATALWVVFNRPRTVKMNYFDSSIAAKEEHTIERTPTAVTEPPTAFPSLYAGLSDFLIKTAIRAAQNYAVYCLEDWIAPTRASVLKTTRAASSGDESPAPVRQPRGPERADWHRDKLEPVLLAASAKK